MSRSSISDDDLANARISARSVAVALTQSRARTCTNGAVYRDATAMARRSRKRKPRSSGVQKGSPASDRRSKPAASPGARVARVAVDDDTWTAFRELCAPTPASVRLGDLVRSEVARASALRDPTAEALDALRVISDQTAALEALVRRR